MTHLHGKCMKCCDGLCQDSLSEGEDSGMAMGRDRDNKGEEVLLYGCPKYFFSKLLPLSILVFENFTFYKPEESLVITMLGIPKIRCTILPVSMLSSSYLKHYLLLYGPV